MSGQLEEAIKELYIQLPMVKIQLQQMLTFML